MLVVGESADNSEWVGALRDLAAMESQGLR